MKRLTYNNLMKAIRYLQREKHYDFATSEKLARNAFAAAERTTSTTVEFYLAQVLSKEEFEREYIAT